MFEGVKGVIRLIIWIAGLILITLVIIYTVMTWQSFRHLEENMRMITDNGVGDQPLRMQAWVSWSNEAENKGFLTRRYRRARAVNNIASIADEVKTGEMATT